MIYKILSIVMAIAMVTGLLAMQPGEALGANNEFAFSGRVFFPRRPLQR